MKTSELTGLALRYAVALAGDWNGARSHCNLVTMPGVQAYRPDLLWEHGGPIIERERLHLKPVDDTYRCYDYNATVWQYGPTPLIAAMRCFVASKLGDEVDVPEELL